MYRPVDSNFMSDVFTTHVMYSSSNGIAPTAITALPVAYTKEMYNIVLRTQMKNVLTMAYPGFLRRGGLIGHFFHKKYEKEKRAQTN